MARPVGADAEATRARVLDCASRLFSARGSGDTSMRDIARAAQVSLATVHHYFGSKDELYRASVDAMYQELQALRGELTREMAAATSVAEIIEQAVRATFRFAREHRAAVQLSMRDVIDTGELPEERRTGMLLPFLDEGAPLVAQVTGQTEERVRLVLMSMNHLIARYSLTTGRELAAITRTPRVAGSNDDTAAEAAIEDHLVEVCLRLLGVTKDTEQTAG